MPLSHVFVSSTFKDLEPYRAAVTRAIITAGDMPGDMVYWPANDAPPIDACIERIRASDLVVLIVAHRYGYIPIGGVTSITETEFSEALAQGIPVLAFLLDVEHPWPPKWVEREPEARHKLEVFRNRVSTETSAQRFTTPESLETAVTHAIAAFRNRMSPTPLRLRNRRRAVVPLPSAVLRHTPDAYLRVGVAPDGAPLLLRVRRSIRLESVMSQLADAVGADPTAPDFGPISDEIAQQAKAHAVKRNLRNCLSPEGMRECYVTTKTMSKLFAPSLLESVIGGISDCADPDKESDLWSRGRARPSTTPTSTAVGLMPHSRDPRIQSTGGRNRFLCMPLDGESTPWSGGWSDEPKRRMQLWRAFEEESVERFTDVRYELFRRNKSTVADEVIYRGRDRQRYLETWRDLLLEEDSSELDRLGSRVEVSRRSVAEFLLAVCEEISKLHQNGEIHGDIKPSNILAARVGPSVIDAVGLRAGDVCPLATAGWSPPEQLTRKPLSCSADVYTLALLFLRCLGGQRLGKLVTFRMPDGMDALHIDDPAVYFSQEKGILVGEGRQEWGHVLSKALCSRPAERYADAGAFLEATTAALAVEAPGGELTFELPWGDKPALSNFQTGHGEIVWVITG